MLGRLDGVEAEAALGDLREHALRLLTIGARILAGPAYLDGFGQGSATVLDDDGAVVAEWHSAGQAALLHTIWEDDDHVLALVFQDDAWAILRLDVTDGWSSSRWRRCRTRAV